MSQGMGGGHLLFDTRCAAESTFMSYSVIPSKVFSLASTCVRVFTILLYLGTDTNESNLFLTSIMAAEDLSFST